MKYLKYGSIGLGLVGIGLAFVLDLYFVRFVLAMGGCLLLSIGLSFGKWRFIPFWLFILACGLVLTDYLAATNLGRVPLISYQLKTNELVSVYNAIGYRVWECNDELIVDTFYDAACMCDDEALKEEDSNVFISNIVSEYDEMKNKFVKIRGKVSKIESIEYIDIQAYEFSTVTVNGYVTFADNVVLRFKFNGEDSNISKYEVYDNVTLIGRVRALKESSGKYVVTFSDAKIVSDDLYDDFEVVLTSHSECDKQSDISLLVEEDTYDVYGSCINQIMVRYSDDVVYELGFLLTSDKLTIEDLLAKAEGVTYDEDSNKLYSYEGFNIVACKENERVKYVIGSSRLMVVNEICVK